MITNNKFLIRSKNFFTNNKILIVSQNNTLALHTMLPQITCFKKLEKSTGMDGNVESIFPIFIQHRNLNLILLPMLTIMILLRKSNVCYLQIQINDFKKISETYKIEIKSENENYFSTERKGYVKYRVCRFKKHHK